MTICFEVLYDTWSFQVISLYRVDRVYVVCRATWVLYRVHMGLYQDYIGLGDKYPNIEESKGTIPKCLGY